MKKQKFITATKKAGRLAILPAFLLATLLGAVALGQPVQADDNQKPDYRLQISPTQDNIGKLEPGSTYEGEVNVQNTGNKAYSYTVSVSPFSVKSGDYDQDFNSVSGYTLVTDWLTLSDTKGTVEPSSQNTVKYTIRVPKDAPGGLQSAAIMITMVNSEEMKASGVQTVSRAAFPVYMNINGDIKETGAVIQNKIPSFIFNPPLVVSSIVENSGNSYTNATYRMEVYNLFGGKMVYTNAEEDHNGDEKIDREVIFPETERYNEVEWSTAPSIGIFRVKQTVTIFDKTDTKEKIVLICPIWLLLIIIAVIGIAVYKIVSAIMKRKDNK